MKYRERRMRSNRAASTAAALAAIVLRKVSSNMHPTRRTRIHPKGLQSPLESQATPQGHRDE